MKNLGRHLLIEFYGCDFSLLDDVTKLRGILSHAVIATGAEVVDIVSHHFSPQGSVVVIIIEESHLVISTWPEYGYAAIDIFTCGERTNPEKALDFLIDNLKPTKTTIMEIKRGIFTSKNS